MSESGETIYPADIKAADALVDGTPDAVLRSLAKAWVRNGARMTIAAFEWEERAGRAEQRVLELESRERERVSEEMDSEETCKHLRHDVTFGKGGPGGRCSTCNEDLTAAQGLVLRIDELRARARDSALMCESEVHASAYMMNENYDLRARVADLEVLLGRCAPFPASCFREVYEMCVHSFSDEFGNGYPETCVELRGCVRALSESHQPLRRARLILHGVEQRRASFVDPPLPVVQGEVSRGDRPKRFRVTVEEIPAEGTT